MQILVVDDKKNIRDMLSMALTKKGYKVTDCPSAKDAVEILMNQPVDLVITDIKMPNVSGLELLKKVKKISPETAVILITAYGTVENAVTAMQLGAVDFIEKPFDLETIEKKIVDIREIERNSDLPNQSLVGSSESMEKLRQLIKKVAPTSASVVITGESGTGKELVARAIHDNSSRKDQPFIAINCAALVETLLEDELFGHEKGAFTGAYNTKKGCFELASGGTLFLDEIGETHPNLQVKLLRVLQEQKIKRVGATKLKSIDVRIIAATNKNIFDLIQQRKFREDLYYRLNVMNINIPSLRERKEDIIPLCHYYLKKYTETKAIKFSPQALECLQNYYWPGNIRELKNVIQRGSILVEGDILGTEELPLEVFSSLPVPAKNGKKMNITTQLELIEKKIIWQVLKKFAGNQTKAAKELGISRSVLQYKIKKFDIKL